MGGEAEGGGGEKSGGEKDGVCDGGCGGGGGSGSGGAAGEVVWSEYAAAQLLLAIVTAAGGAIGATGKAMPAPLLMVGTEMGRMGMGGGGGGGGRGSDSCGEDATTCCGAE